MEVARQECRAYVRLQAYINSNSEVRFLTRHTLSGL
jgi:hypothetical protein